MTVVQGWMHALLRMSSQRVSVTNILSRWITDQPTLDAIKKLTEDLKTEKAALHPEKQQ
jgi:hypothetical protein